MRALRKPNEKELEKRRLKEESDKIRNAINSFIIRQTLGAKITQKYRESVS